MTGRMRTPQGPHAVYESELYIPGPQYYLQF